uniref:Mediator of RNA polymerase II transcription subunit 8 n=1 Tax=Corethrella appendiculata TaxID=1370023 RepID=U5EYA0_9DIPT
MQREEKQLDMLLEAVLNRLNELKTSISSMIHKIETESISWPVFLDNFALISSHLTGLSKILSHELGTPLTNLTVLPLMLTPERDEVLLQLTEGRIPVFSHDLVPDYLRTKSEPAAEARMLQNEQKANNLNAEAAMKHIAQYTKVVSHVWDIISKNREEWEVEASSRSGVQQTSSMTDTQTLVAAVGMGKGLKMTMPVGPGPAGIMVPPAMRPGIIPGPIGPAAISPGTGKAPSAIKTNIKSANQIHPYGR